MKIEVPEGEKKQKKEYNMKTIELTPTTVANFNSTAQTTNVSNIKKAAEKCKEAARKLIKEYLDFCKFVKPMYDYQDHQFTLEKEA